MLLYLTSVYGENPAAEASAYSGAALSKSKSPKVSRPTPKLAPGFLQNPNRQWWFAIAQGDLDFDGTLSEWFISSETREAYNRQGNNL